mmetsp:Transcript_76131/g.164734  ORF Transcript_76131/g.164734 Transcript_76131/m.164734 type:complete len:184 (+) Transcript_76131:2-553(+)
MGVCTTREGEMYNSNTFNNSKSLVQEEVSVINENPFQKYKIVDSPKITLECGIQMSKVKYNDEVHLMKSIPVNLGKQVNPVLSNVMLSQNLDHPNIFRWKELFHYKNVFYLISPSKGLTTVAEFNLDNTIVSDSSISYMILQFLSVLKYINKYSLIHTNLHPSLILISPSDFFISIADFSLMK